MFSKYISKNKFFNNDFNYNIIIIIITYTNININCYLLDIITLIKFFNIKISY